MAEIITQSSRADSKLNPGSSKRSAASQLLTTFSMPAKLQTSGDSISSPAPMNQAVETGQVTVTLSSFSSGDDVVDQILSADPSNPAPVTGVTYALFYANLQNQGNQSLIVDGEDFALVGSSGRVWRGSGLTAPDPPLQAAIDPGGAAEGWVVCRLGVTDDNVVAWFDSRELSGNWTDAFIALSPGASMPAAAAPAQSINEAGSAPDSPAGVGTLVATSDWALTLQDVVYAQDVFNLYGTDDYRTTALGEAAPELVDYWIGLQVSIVNNQTGSVPAHFPATALSLGWEDGSSVTDVRLLSPPMPELQGDYFPGGGATGWITIELPSSYDGSLLRFDSFADVGQPRYLTWGDGSAPVRSDGEVATPEPASAQFETGTVVTVTEEDVNLREGPGTSFAVVGVLTKGDELTIEAGPEDEDGFSWYQINAIESDLTGYVASNFLRVKT